MIKGFYPTKKTTIHKMIAKIKTKGLHNCYILDPSAGKGDIIDILVETTGMRKENISAIEINEDLQSILRGKNIKVIDTDFLNFNGPEKFDIIIANPPFDEGDKHLLKAIDIMYRGEIIFLLNAETLRNPCTNTRKVLATQLKELNAEIEYLQDEFIDAERKTKVEIAMVYIKIERSIEKDLFQDVNDIAQEVNPEIEEKHEVSNRKTIQEMVAEYNEIVRIGTETILGYYKNYRKIGSFIGLNQEAGKDYSNKDMTGKMQSSINEMIIKIRKSFWMKALDLKDVRSRLTAKKQDDFYHQIQNRSNMDFTESNIRQFIMNLIGNYDQMLTEATLEVFNLFTEKHCWSDNLYDDNIHYFNGWKTNKAFKVGEKVIVPFYGGGDGGRFVGWSGKWEIDYSVKSTIRDIDKVMNFFDGRSEYYSIIEALEHAFIRGESRKIESTYFTVTVYKKGTIHLVFNDKNILRRFNVAACKGKNWLPHDYGQKGFANMNSESKDVVNSFEGEKIYSKNLNQPLFASKNMIAIPFNEDPPKKSRRRSPKP